MAEKAKLLDSGFSNWMRRDFNAFVRACEKYGRSNLKDIASEIDGKSDEEVPPPPPPATPHPFPPALSLTLTCPIWIAKREGERERQRQTGLSANRSSRYPTLPTGYGTAGCPSWRISLSA